jgi:xanthine phosphoribosyltransferase
MQLLKQRILEEGWVLGNDILKVDSFLNHQIDVALINEMGKEFFRIFGDRGINKILTIEASGIGIACITAQYFNVPVVFAKKTESRNLDADTYISTVFSYTRGKEYEIRVSRKYLNKEDRVLIIDDFLANGNAVLGLKSLIDQAGATLAGVGIVIEKKLQGGGKRLQEKGVEVHSLAVIQSMENGDIIFA